MQTQEMKIDLDRVILPHGRLLVREIAPETASPGGIIIPDISRQDRRIATVVKLGRTHGEPFAPEHSLVDVGDEVLVSRVAMSSQVAYELGDGLHIIDVRDILAVVKPTKGETP